MVRGRARGEHPLGGDLDPYNGTRGLSSACHRSFRRRFAKPLSISAFTRGRVPVYRVLSMNVTLLISFKVVTPVRTFSSAEVRRGCMPSSLAARRISDVGLRA